MNRHAIAIFCHNFEINGANYFVLTLASALSKHAHLTVLSPKGGDMISRFTSAGINCVIIDELYNFEYLKRYDVVIINTLMMSAAVLECVKRNVPHILIVHETWLPEKINYYINDLWNIPDVNSSDILRALESSRKVIFPAKYLERVYESLVDDSRRDTIYCTIDMEMIDKYRAANSRDAARAALGIGKDEVVFLQVGTVTRRKAQMTTLRAFHEVYNGFRRTRNISLMFVGARNFRPGEREYIAEIRNKISDMGISDVVKIYNVTDDIFRYYTAADILVHPSINEVLPISILEACYFELAVVVSNLDGMPEVIQHEIDGMLVNPYDIDTVKNSMIELVNKPDMRRSLGRNARKKITEQHALVGFEKNYNELVNTILENVVT